MRTLNKLFKGHMCHRGEWDPSTLADIKKNYCWTWERQSLQNFQTNFWPTVSHKTDKIREFNKQKNTL